MRINAIHSSILACAYDTWWQPATPADAWIPHQGQDSGSSGKANANWYGSGEGQREGQRVSTEAENEKSASRARIRSDFAKQACY